MIQNNQNEAQSYYQILQKIVDACKKYKVPEDVKNENQQNKLFVILLGVTGVGKTTLFNYLRGAQMKQPEFEFNGVVNIELENNDENKQYKIGNTSKSQTMEPIHICFKHKGKEMILVDTPGYGATNQQNYTKQEQQWLDSLKMRKYFKKCKKCILLLIMNESQFTDRSHQFDHKDFQNYIQSLTGISEISQLSKGLRIIFNKSKLQDESGKKKLIDYLNKELSLQNQQVQDEQQQQNQQKYNYKENSLKYFIEILSKKNNKDKFEFHIIPQVEENKMNVYDSKEKREEILDFIQSLEPQDMSPQPFFQNQDTLKLYLYNIRDKLYKIEVDKLMKELDSVTDEIMKSDKKIVVFEDLSYGELSFMQILNKFFGFKVYQKQVQYDEPVQKNENCDIIYSIMNCLLECHEELYFQKPIMKYKGAKVEYMKNILPLKKRIKKFATRLDKLIKLMNNYKKTDYQFKDFMNYYHIIRKFTITTITEQQDMLQTRQIRGELQKQIEKISQLKNKYDKELFGRGFLDQFKIKRYFNNNTECIFDIQSLLGLLTNIYLETLQFCKQQQAKLVEFIKNDKTTERYYNDDFRKDSNNQQSLKELLKKIKDCFDKTTNQLICQIFNAPSNELIDDTKLRILLENKIVQLTEIRSSSHHMLEQGNLIDELNEQTTSILIHLATSNIIDDQVKKLVNLLPSLDLYYHNSSDVFYCLQYINDNCFQGWFQNINFLRKKSEYSDKYYQPALDKINTIIERIKIDLEQIQWFSQEISIAIIKEEEEEEIKIECNQQ